jgi:hypothetical protein
MHVHRRERFDHGIRGFDQPDLERYLQHAPKVSWIKLGTEGYRAQLNGATLTVRCLDQGNRRTYGLFYDAPRVSSRHDFCKVDVRGAKDKEYVSKGNPIIAKLYHAAVGR